MIQLVKLPTRRQEIDVEMLEALDSLRSRVIAGELGGLAWAAITIKGESITGWTDHLDAPALIGAVTIVQHRMIENRATDESPAAMIDPNLLARYLERVTLDTYNAGEGSSKDVGEIHRAITRRLLASLHTNNYQILSSTELKKRH